MKQNFALLSSNEQKVYINNYNWHQIEKEKNLECTKHVI